MPDGPAVALQLNAGHTGFTAGTNGERGSLVRAWDMHLSDEGTASYPVIADGLVFAIVFAGGMVLGSRIVALDADTGDERWRRELEHGGVLGYGSGNLYVVGADSLVLALDPLSGDIRWTRQLEQTDPRLTPFDDRLYVATPDRVVALDAQDGSEIWSFHTQEAYGAVAPAVDAGGVYVAAGCEVHRLDPRTGDPLWTTPEGCDHHVNLVLDGTRLMVSAPQDEDRIVLRTLDGEHVRSHDSETMPVATPLATIEIRPGYQLTSVDELTGRPRWSHDRGSHAFPPLAVGGAVYYVTSLKGLSVVDEASGRLLFRDTTLAPPPGSAYPPTHAMAAGGGLLVVPSDGGLVAYRNG